MRGKRYSKKLREKKPGITPAGAGKTVRGNRLPMRTRDHPRRCGENCLEGGFRQGALGSPPQVRGKLGVRARCRLHDRITPAGAGKTVDKWELVRMIRDHPRRCGENGISGRETELTQGSPPRMRGKPFCGIGIYSADRITPADAGKTVVFLFYTTMCRDHPRGCGENLLEKTKAKTQ